MLNRDEFRPEQDADEFPILRPSASALPRFDALDEPGAEDLEDEPALDRRAERPMVAYRGSTSDPLFGFLLAIAVSIGLTPILPASADLRYSLAWGALAAVGVLSWLLGSNMERIEQESVDNVVWGVSFGALFSLPFLLFFAGTFHNASRLLFPQMSAGTLLAFLVFVMPLGETLFFRGLLQRNTPFYITGGLAGLWSIILFFPVMWGEILSVPAVAFFIAVALFAMNLLYSYVRERNSLAAAWLCQICVNLVLFFLPHIL